MHHSDVYLIICYHSDVDLIICYLIDYVLTSLQLQLYSPRCQSAPAASIPYGAVTLLDFTLNHLSRFYNLPSLPASLTVTLLIYVASTWISTTRSEAFGRFLPLLVRTFASILYFQHHLLPNTVVITSPFA